MLVRHTDKSIVKWAVEQGFAYEYAREYGLPQPSLRVRLGLSTAYFDAGQLIRWYADIEGTNLDQLMFELTSLFLGCTQTGAFPIQCAEILPAERNSLEPPGYSA